MVDMNPYITAVEDSGGDAAVFYRSEILSIFDLDTVEQREEAFRLLALQYLTKERQQSADKQINTILRMALPTQISRRQNYDRSIIGGENGGRPQTVNRSAVWHMRDSGMSQMQIATELGCSTKTVQRIMKEGRPVNMTEGTSAANPVESIPEKAHVWDDERPAYDRPFVAEAAEQQPEYDDDLPF